MTTNDLDIILCARHLGCWLHRDQTDNHGEPYAAHIRRVANLVGRCGGTAEQRAAGYLHDAIEDGHIGVGALRAVFPHPLIVAPIVWTLTRDKDAESYAEYIARIVSTAAGSDAGRLALLVKLCDLYDNLSRLPAGDSLTGRYRAAWPIIAGAMQDHGIAVDLKMPTEATP